MLEVTLNNGVVMPQLGFGVWRIPAEETHAAVTRALDAGYRSIDTAALYENEESVGRAVRDSGIPRDQVFITTKVWNDDQGYDRTLRAFDASLDRLGMDYVDLYLIHWPAPSRDLYVETWRALEKVNADGRARAIGVSNFTSETLGRLVTEGEVVPAVNQIELHPYLAQLQMRRVDTEAGVITEAWGPIGRGKGLLDEPVLRRIGDKHGKTPAQVVIRWHLQVGTIAIPKSVTPSRIKENIDVFDFDLGADDMAEIDALDRGERYGPDPADV